MVEVSQPLAVIQSKELPKGTPEYEKKRTAILAAFAEEVPSELRLARDLIENPPLNVTDIPRTCGILSPKEIDITENHDATGLAELIATKQLTAVEVARAFSKRAIIAHQLTCCLTQWFMEDAIRQAQGLDDYLEKHGKTIGPLHGVPISAKEHMQIAQTYTSEGCFSSTVLNEHDSHMISIFRCLGAVFYCKTNQPQGIMHLESTSHYGRSLNPFNIHLSPGGSSGGESALQSMKGSVLGIGTDIGGSIRAPSAFCGIYGFKPTSDTLPMRDFLSHTTGAELNISPSTGPMCRSLRDMDLFTKSLIDAKPWLVDPRLIPQKWTGLRTELPKSLKIGIIENDGFIIPQPPVQRAIKWLKERLSDPRLSSTIEVKAFKPYDAAGAWSKIRRMYWPEAALPLKSAIESTGEPLHPLTEWITADAKPHGMLDADGVTHLRFQRDQFRLSFAESWNEQDVDVVIGPAFVGPAPAHDTAFYWTYTSLYNFVDYPGAVFPTPIVADANDVYDTGYQPLSKECAHVRQLWEASNFEGAPINLQIVGRRYHDNELFGVLELLKDVLDLP